MCCWLVTFNVLLSLILLSLSLYMCYESLLVHLFFFVFLVVSVSFFSYSSPSHVSYTFFPFWMFPRRVGQIADPLSVSRVFFVVLLLISISDSRWWYVPVSCL